MDRLHADAGHMGAQVIQIESGKLIPLIVLLTLVAGIAIGLSIFSYSKAQSAETEARMLEYYLLELDAKFINAGLKDPAESIAKRLQTEKSK